MPAAVRSADPGGAVAAAPLAPPLKWAGGKRWQVPILEPLWRPHAHRRLVEPFCGGLAVALGLRPERALLNDVNPHLVAFYRWLQRGLRIELPLENDETLYYAHRARYNALVARGEGDGAEAAGLFYFLNRTGYNGLCRFNRAGAFNVPFGTYARIRYTRDFAAYRQALAPWVFSHGDIESVPFDAADFVYADPPYDVPFTHYARGGFSWDDQVRAATHLAAHPGPVVLVNQATPRIRALYERLGYQLQFHDAPRRISCTGDRTRAPEVLATRNLHTMPGPAPA
jgi:DNA adenine methylase